MKDELKNQTLTLSLSLWLLILAKARSYQYGGKDNWANPNDEKVKEKKNIIMICNLRESNTNLHLGRVES